MQEMPGSEFTLPADLVLLAMGFVSPVQSLLDEFGVEKDARGNAKAATDGPGLLRDLGRQGVRRRRRAARPVAGGVGDTRRPPVRARGGRVPDGIVGTAPVNAGAGGAGPFLQMREGPSRTPPSPSLVAVAMATPQERHVHPRAAAAADAVHAGLADAPGGTLSARIQRNARARRQLPGAVPQSRPRDRSHAAAARALSRSTRRSSSRTSSPIPDAMGLGPALRGRRGSALRAAAARGAGHPQPGRARTRTGICATCSTRSPRCAGRSPARCR